MQCFAPELAMKWKTLVLASTCSVSALACAQQEARTPPRLTSAQMPHTHDATLAERKLGEGSVGGALEMAEEEESLGPNDPWAYYDRAVALEELGRVSEAAEAFLEAESRFEGRDDKGKAVSIYGRAHVFASAGRCSEAKEAYREYAAFVRSDAPQKAEMALRYAEDCFRPWVADPATEAASSAVVGGDYARALAETPARGGAWLAYNRAVAQSALRRTDEAVASFRSAESSFGAGELRERSLAVYGQARALNDAVRCSEARAVYEEYADLVRATNPRDAAMALAYARDCNGPYRW
jgi:tetratricopeptide (TPR) repeat protein